MKKNIMLIIIMLICSITTFGQFKPWSNLYTIDVGAAMLNGSETSSSLTGYDFSFVYDYISSDTDLTGGFTFGYMKATEETSTKSVAYTTFPVALQGKYFPSSGGRYVYLQGGIGIHFSEAERLGDNGYISGSDSGILLLAGVGSFIELDKTLFLNIAYNFNWLDSQLYQNGLVHTIKIGLAFQ